MNRREFAALFAKLAVVAVVPAPVLATAQGPIHVRITEVEPTSDLRKFAVDAEENGQIFRHVVVITNDNVKDAYHIAKAIKKLKRDVAYAADATRYMNDAAYRFAADAREIVLV